MKLLKEFKTWLSVGNPQKFILFLQFLTAIIPAIISIITAIQSANLITNLSVFNYT